MRKARTFQLISFTTILTAEAGSKLATTATAGNPTLPRVIRAGDRTPMVIGPTPISVGPGSRTKTGVGPRITTDVGSGSPISAGFGDLVMNGVRHGSHGVSAAVIAD